MGTLYDARGKPVEVPDAQVTQALISGQYGTKAASVMVQARDGKTYSVPTENLGKFAEGSPGLRVMSDAEAQAHEAAKHERELQARYGGVGGQLAAGASGLASGATLGASDFLLGAALSKESKEYLERAKEANPITTTGANIVGAIAPAILSGGETAPESLAELGAKGAVEAGEVGKVAKALGVARDVVSAPARTVEGLSSLTEHGVAGLIGSDATGFAGLAQRGIAKAAGGAVAGGVSTAAMDLGENAVSTDHQLTGEQLLSHATLGALLGGGLGLASEGASTAIERLLKTGIGEEGTMADHVSKWAAEMQADATGAKAKEWRMLEAKGLSKEELGRWQLDELSKYTKDGKAPMSREAIQTAAQAAMEDAGPKIEEHVKTLDLAGNRPAWEPTVERLRREVVDPLAESVDPRSRAVGRSIGELVDNSAAKLGESPSFEQMLDLRREIQSQLNYHRADPAQATFNSEAKKVRTILEDEIGKQGEIAGGVQWKKGYDAAKKQYRMAASVDDVIESASPRIEAHNKVGLSDMIAGASTHTGLLAAGHPHALLLSAAAAIGHHVLKTYGDAVGSRLLDAFAKSGTLQRIVQPQLATRSIVAAQKSYQQTAVRAVTALVHGQRVAEAPGRPEGDERGFDRRAAAIKGMLKNPQAFTAAIQAHAEALGPGFQTVASSYQKGAIAQASYLAQQMPRPKPINPLTPKAGTIEPSAAEKAAFNRVFDAVHEPLGIMKRAASGSLTRAEVDAVAATAPAILSDIQQRIQMAMGHVKEPLAPAQAAAVKMLLGVPVFQMPTPQPQTAPGVRHARGHREAAGGGVARPLKLDLSTTELVGHRVGSTA